MVRSDHFWILSILILFVSMVVISGCTTSITPNKTYTDSFISFQYPSDFKNTTVPTYLTSGDSNWTIVAYFNNSDDVGILVYKYSNISTTVTTESAAQNTLDSEKQANGSSILSSAPQTNPNGIEMWKTISTVKNPHDVAISQDEQF